MGTGFYIINFDIFSDSDSKFDIRFEVLERSAYHMADENYSMVVSKDEEEKKNDEIVCSIVLKECVVEFFKHETFFNAIIEFSKKNPDFMISITEQEHGNKLEIKDLTTDEAKIVLAFDTDKNTSFNVMFKVIHNHLFNNE